MSETRKILTELNHLLEAAYEGDDPFTINIAARPVRWLTGTGRARKFNILNRAPYIDSDVNVLGFMAITSPRTEAVIPLMVAEYSDDLPFYLFRIMSGETIERAAEFVDYPYELDFKRERVF